jgi:hypothetical protein
MARAGLWKRVPGEMDSHYAHLGPDANHAPEIEKARQEHELLRQSFSLFKVTRW